jgi:hypothetical protein
MHDHFVIIGAQRCGTTYLARLLDEHPDVEMAKPFRPEPKFFLDDERCAKGLDFYEEQLFTGNTRVRGEKSTSYIESERAVQRIVELLPDALVIVVVRDPVDRAVSNHRFSTEHGVEHLPLAEGLRAATGAREWDRSAYSVSPFAYLERGLYVDYLERVARHVSRERLHVLVFEELVADPDTIAALLTRLGVDPTFRPAALGVAANASAGDGSLDPETESWLRDYFAEPNRRLAAFLGRALPWPVQPDAG